MYQVTICVENEQDLGTACQEVANAIDNGYYSGMLNSVEGNSWSIEKV